MCANIFLIPTTSNYLRSSFVGVVKVDYFDFSCKKIEKHLYDQIVWWQAMDISLQKMKICWSTQLKNPIAWILYSTDNEFNLKCLIREGARTGSCSKMCITFQVVLPFSEQNLLILKSLLLKQNSLKKM